MTLPLRPRAAPGQRRVLGIDPGTHCGVAVVDIDDEGVVTPVHVAVVDIHDSELPFPHDGDKWATLYRAVEALLDEHHPDYVAYEKVFAHKGVTAGHVYGGVVAVLELVCCDRQVLIIPIGVGTVKKHAVGHGNAPKAELQTAAFHLLGRVPSTDEADALFVAIAAPAPADEEAA